MTHKFHYLSLACFLVAGAGSCRDAGAPRIELPGEYVAVSVNGSRLPAEFFSQSKLLADTLRFDRAGVATRGSATRSDSSPFTISQYSETLSYRIDGRTIELFFPCPPLADCVAGPYGTIIALDVITIDYGGLTVAYQRAR